MKHQDQILKIAEEAEVKISKIRSELQAIINELPDNPRINRMSSRSFTISSSALRDGNQFLRLDPFFHDFKAQYQKVCDIIETCHPENITSVLQEIVKDQSYRTRGVTYHFHIDVIDNLKKRLDIL